MAFDERSGDHAAWNRAGFWWYDYDREGRLLGVEDTHSSGVGGRRGIGYSFRLPGAQSRRGTTGTV